MSPIDLPLRIVPRISPLALGVCGALHAFSVLLVLVLAWPWSPALLISAALILVSTVATARELTRVPQRFAAILLTSEQTWVATDLAGNRHVATQGGSPVISDWFVVVPLRIGKARYTWLATADATPPALLRRLRVRLRFESSKSAAAF